LGDWLVALVRHRKRGERRIGGLQHLNSRRPWCGFHFVDHVLLRTRHLTDMEFEDLVPIVAQLRDLHAERFETLSNPV
jgi:hypothetical protein